MGILYGKLRIAMAAIGVMVMLPLSSILADGYPWWLVVTQTPTAGWFRLESSFATNMTTTVVRLYGEAVTNMTNNGRTSTVYFSSISGSNAWSWIQGNSNIVVWSSNSLINISNVLFNLPTDTWNTALQPVNTQGLFKTTFFSEGLTNGFGATGQTLYITFKTNYSASSSSTNLNTSLWSFDSDNDLIPNTSATVTVDMWWKLDSDGDLVPR